MLGFLFYLNDNKWLTQTHMLSRIIPYFMFKHRVILFTIVDFNGTQFVIITTINSTKIKIKNLPSINFKFIFSNSQLSTKLSTMKFGGVFTILAMAMMSMLSMVDAINKGGKFDPCCPPQPNVRCFAPCKKSDIDW